MGWELEGVPQSFIICGCKEQSRLFQELDLTQIMSILHFMLVILHTGCLSNSDFTFRTRWGNFAIILRNRKHRDIEIEE